jgi:hypothetical protein
MEEAGASNQENNNKQKGEVEKGQVVSGIYILQIYVDAGNDRCRKCVTPSSNRPGVDGRAPPPDISPEMPLVGALSLSDRQNTSPTKFSQQQQPATKVTGQKFHLQVTRRE